MNLMLTRYHEALKTMHARHLISQGLSNSAQASIDAAQIGRLGASKGGIERAKSLSSKKRSSIASKAAKSRWS